MNLVVYAGGTRVGALDMAANEPFYGFAYDEAYLQSENPTPLSLSLPLQRERYDGAHALPYFEGLLPEGDARATIARHLGISERSPAKLLRALGKDCAGDVTILEEDDPYQPPDDKVYSRFNGDLARIAANPFGEISNLRAVGRLSLAGGQEKISLYHDKREPIGSGWWVPLAGSPSTHIVKPQTYDAYPLLVENEFFCMRLARQCGMNVAETHLVPYERSVLVVRRFDRLEAGRKNDDGLEVYRRLRQEDFCQALGFDSSRKYEADGGPRISDMCRLLIENSAQFIQDRDELLKLLSFNYLIGNCDAHAKNYSLMLGSAGAIRLAPAYDIVSTTVYDDTFGSQLSRSMGMSIGTHSNIDRVVTEDFAILASNVGVAASKVMRDAKSICAAMLDGFDSASYDLRQCARNDTAELTRRILVGIERRARVIGA